MDIFYSNNINDNIIELSASESHHCMKVMRKKRGDLVIVLDGNGCRYIATIIEVDKKNILLEIKNKDKIPQNTMKLHLIISPTKSHDRIDWLIEKATEIGVTKISFLGCEHSERRKINLDRLKKKAISALKQCQNLWLPEINNIQSFEQFITSTNHNEGKYIAYVNADRNLHLLTASKEFPGHLILIGPEGDFTGDEVDAAINHGFKPVSLGLNTLRTETAGLVACTLLNS